MCLPRGKIAGVFLKWCDEYRTSGMLTESRASELAAILDGRFVVKTLQLTASDITSGSCREKAVQFAKRCKNEMHAKKKLYRFCGVYRFLPREPPKSNIIETSDEQADPYLAFNIWLGDLGNTVFGRCIQDSFSYNSENDVFVIIPFAEKELYHEISESNLWAKDYQKMFDAETKSKKNVPKKSKR